MCQKAKEWAKSEMGMSEEAATYFGKESDIGDVMFVDDNYCECGIYYIGDHRCKCGNRRISVENAKKLNGEFYFWTDVY